MLKFFYTSYCPITYPPSQGINLGGRFNIKSGDGNKPSYGFLISLFFAPLAGSIPAYATAGALLYVAVLMAGSLAHANWEDPTDAAPVLIAALAMPLTFSIAEGIALGFISYVAIKTLSGRFSDLNPAVVVLALLFAAKFLFLG